MMKIGCVVKKKAPVARTTEASCQIHPSKGINDMNSVAKTDLTFQNFTFNPVTENGQVWLTSAELAKAIGYKKTDAISQLYSRNADEFTNAMTTTLKMSVVRKTGTVDMVVRLFSLRGAHLIAMFASTPVAKQFRKWALDILDREVAVNGLDEHLLLRNLTTAYKHIKRINEIWGGMLSPSLRRLNMEVDSEMTGRLKDVQGPLFSSLTHMEWHSKARLTH
ncbi:BRO-N domain-containing protein [Morganella morganii]|uniref:BRO-N domain-containing protein n=1 Tax=Morganella morganii TaxID=582 RepID=UPI001FFCCDA5|nr:BRO family protein [Morganella morganii]